MVDLVIYSDIRMYREGLNSVLSKCKHISVVGLIGSNQQLLVMLNTKNINVVLIDMRGCQGFSELSNIVSINKDIKIIVMALPESNINYQKCLELGVTGYLPKEAAIEEFVEAINCVANDRFYCPASITKHLLKMTKKEITTSIVKKENRISSQVKNQLTRREIQILELLLTGLSNKKIASSLTIQLSTVKNHVHNILVKIGANSRTHLIHIIHNGDKSHQYRSLDLVKRVMSI